MFQARMTSVQTSTGRLRLATWNLNNRVGKVRFRPKAADAAVALGADVLVFTEFFPREFEIRFRNTLEDAGWNNQHMSQATTAVANRILVASKLQMRPVPIELPTFDQQFPANVLAVEFPSVPVVLLSVRVPAYSGKSGPLLEQAWQWLEAAAGSLRDRPAVLAGDLNVSLSHRSRAGAYFRRILANGWKAAAGGGPTFFGHNGSQSEIDYILATSHCRLGEATCVKEVRDYVLVGSARALSDHGAVMCDIAVPCGDPGVGG